MTTERFRTVTKWLESLRLDMDHSGRWMIPHFNAHRTVVFGAGCCSGLQVSVPVIHP